MFSPLCVRGGGLVHWLNNSQTPQPSVNVANAAPTNSDSWNDAGNYSTTAPQGSGTEADPYLISTAEELAWISVNYNGSARGKYFKQMANIDLGAHYWVPINNSSSSRAYYYDGDNHTISNLFIDTSVQTLSSNNYIGLFGRVYGSSSTHAYIKNLGIVGGSVSGEQYVGAVVGSAVYTDITSCYNEGVSVTGNNTYVGGITGSGSPMRCYNTGTVSSTSTSSSSSSSYVGGITGSGSPTICYNSGDVSSSGGRVGGIAGSGSSELCYNTGNVFSAGDRVGGITGSGGVSGCYNLGSVTGVGDNVGGVSGYNDSYSSTAYSYYDSSAVTTSNSYGTPLSLQQMTVITEGIAPEAMKGFFISEWNFVEGQTPKPNMEGYDYGTTEMPVLQDPNSSNSETNPYIIDTEAKLAYLSANSSWAQDKYFLQTTNLDFSEYEYFVPINVDELYPGRYYYDGGNYAISNINIQTARNNVGLFGYTYDPYNEKAIYIKNIVLSNGNISGGSYVGGIVGEASRTNVKNCFNNGVTITAGGSYVGGIVGNGNNVNGCYNSGDVTSTSTSSSSYVGGITKFFICWRNHRLWLTDNML